MFGDLLETWCDVFSRDSGGLMTVLRMNNGLFLQPKHLPPSAWLGHIPFAGWLLASAPPSLLVELGTHYGTSYLAMCQTIAEHALSTRCFAVDSWRGDAHAGAYDDRIFLELNDYHQRHYAAFSRLLRMNFDEALPYFADGSIDLLHIDGYHTYEAVRHDFETWLPKMSARGIVLFHDTAVREKDFGVWRLWSELRQRYPCFEFGHSHGLGVLFVGADVPLSLRFLADGLDAQEASQFNRIFQMLGENIVNVSEIQRLNTAVEACHGEIARLTGVVDEQARGALDMDALRAQIDASNAQFREEVFARLNAFSGDVQHRAGATLNAIDTLCAHIDQDSGRLRAEADVQRESQLAVAAQLEVVTVQQSAMAQSIEDLKRASIGARLLRWFGSR
jgi:Methyltransferase domain